MDESLNEFEVELKGLIPRRLNPALMNRVADDLTACSTLPQNAEKDSGRSVNRFTPWRWLNVGAMGIAAAVIVLLTVIRFSKKEKETGLSATAPAVDVNPVPSRNASRERLAARDIYRPVSAANVLYEMKDEGPVSVQGDTSERRVRYRYVDTYTWKNPRNNASLTWSVPRDEIRVQPAQFN